MRDHILLDLLLPMAKIGLVAMLCDCVVYIFFAKHII